VFSENLEFNAKTKIDNRNTNYKKNGGDVKVGDSDSCFICFLVNSFYLGIKILLGLDFRRESEACHGEAQDRRGQRGLREARRKRSSNSR
jgi:hypothetical protein